MSNRLPLLLAALFIGIAVIQFLNEQANAALLYVALALGTLLHAEGQHRGNRLWQGMGAALVAFSAVILLWLAFS
jgi:hypothetical protein